VTEADQPQATESSTAQAEYDSPWKEALEVYFEPFLALLFPAVHELIDWSRPYESLEQEFQQLAKDAEVGKRFTDKLFKVWRQDGEEAWVLVHIEVQSQEDTGFAERMFVYNYRCFDRYRQPVISLAVLGDDRDSWRPHSYGYALGGCRMGLEFPIAKLLDYEVQWQQLEESLNPFAVMVMAHLKTKATTGEPQQRKQWKWVLVRRLFEQGYSRDDVVELFRLVDWMMGLPKALEQEFRAELRQYQEERQMPYITSVERLAKEEGVQEGIDLGRRQVIENLLKVRFGALDEALTAIVEPLLNLPAEAYTRLLLESSREELIAHFSAGNPESR
jgi:Putative transposase, YhgA-like